jgi:hypothetical protein
VAVRRSARTSAIFTYVRPVRRGRLDEVKAYAGHVDIATTQRYG